METKILPLFDFEHMTRIAMARNSASRLGGAAGGVGKAVQDPPGAHLFLLALSNYRDEGIEYKPLRFAAGETDALVRSVVRRRGAEPLSIDD